MSIAEEINDLQVNLQIAKDAVVEKGGTVGDTGLAGLASEIASIPSGGGTLDNYGSIVYLDANNVEQTLTLATEDDFVALTEGGSGTTIVINNVSLNKDNITRLTVADGVAYLPDKFCYGCQNLVSATLPSSIHFIGSVVFLGTKINHELNLENVRYIGDSFLQLNTIFNQPISLPKIAVIGNGFLVGCTSFNSSLTINDSAKAIGNNFMKRCTNFAQSFSVPSGLEQNIDTSFMFRCDNFTGPLICNTDKVTAYYETLATESASAPMYTTGVTLTGPYAQAWKDVLPDRPSSPYRKLIVAS